MNANSRAMVTTTPDACAKPVQRNSLARLAWPSTVVGSQGSGAPGKSSFDCPTSGG